jgi:type II secretory pathway pseudopilin PulG
MKIKKKNGFSILAIILVIVVIIVAIGVWALSGQSNSQSSSDSNNTVLAATIQNDSSSIKLAYDTLNINGQSNIIFMPNQSASNNMLDPLNGISVPNVPAKAINQDLGGAPVGLWVLDNNFNSNIGPSNPDTAIVLSGLNDGVCKQINKTLYGSDNIPEYGPASGAPYFTSGATSANPNTTQAIDFPSGGTQVNSLTWTMGCIRSPGSTNQNAFFRILKVK